MIEEAIQQTKGRGEWVGAVPEASAVGESQSNGRAERSVQRLEDHVRTLLAELEDRLDHQLRPDSHVVSWLAEYASVLLNKCHVNELLINHCTGIQLQRNWRSFADVSTS